MYAKKTLSKMDEIIPEKISADHLLYVSLKYTKTCDVIYNLLLRWRRIIELGIRSILEKLLEKKKIKEIPEAPLARIKVVRNAFKKDSNMQEILNFYEMLRKIENLRTERIGEFRKNVNLRIFYQGKEINMNLEALKEYSEKLEKFISDLKLFLK